LAANSVPSSNVDDNYYYKQHGNNNNNDKQRLKQQSIEDERGRQVGDWREKSGIDSSGSGISSSGLDSNSGNTNAFSHIPPPPSYCEDPSVALSLQRMTTDKDTLLLHDLVVTVVMIQNEVILLLLK
jgi:hypothetical protein